MKIITIRVDEEIFQQIEAKRGETSKSESVNTTEAVKDSADGISLRDSAASKNSGVP